MTTDWLPFYGWVALFLLAFVLSLYSFYSFRNDDDSSDGAVFAAFSSVVLFALCALFIINGATYADTSDGLVAVYNLALCSASAFFSVVMAGLTGYRMLVAVPHALSDNDEKKAEARMAAYRDSYRKGGA